jgi:hypothetical protein
MRDEFEKWWLSRGYNPQLLQREAEGYRDGTAQIAYFAYCKAALASCDGDKPVAWIFQHQDTGRTTCALDEVEAFEGLNPRWRKVGPLYERPQAAVPVEPVLRGHRTLESMIFTHTNVWRDLILTEIRENRDRPDESYWKHELQALDAIISALHSSITASQEADQ